MLYSVNNPQVPWFNEHAPWKYSPFTADPLFFSPPPLSVGLDILCPSTAHSSKSGGTLEVEPG